jgi:hypothetical protein
MKNELTQEYGCLKVDGKYFKPVEEGERLRYIEISKKEFDNRLSTIKKIAEKLKDSLDKEAVLMEALSKLPETHLSGIWVALNNPIKKVKSRTRKHHCVDMKIGNWIVPIVN